MVDVMQMNSLLKARWPIIRPCSSSAISTSCRLSVPVRPSQISSRAASCRSHGLWERYVQVDGRLLPTPTQWRASA
jgi:hypothetical protein